MDPMTGAVLPIPERPSSRLIVLDPFDRVLLFQFEDASIRDPAHPRGDAQPACFWCTPGGGLEPGETYEQAAHRELWEETGLRVATLGPPVFDEEKALVVQGKPVLHRNRYFLVRVPASELSLAQFTPLEVRVYRAHRWWSLAELEATDDDVFPTQLPDLVRAVLVQA